MEQTTYLCKFDKMGNRGETHATAGIRDEEKSAYLASGFVEIPESEWLYYIGGMGGGINGAGYIRDPKTGKPVSAPPAPPVETTEEPTANVPETELAVMEGMVDMQSRIAALEAELAKLKGGK